MNTYVPYFPQQSVSLGSLALAMVGALALAAALLTAPSTSSYQAFAAPTPNELAAVFAATASPSVADLEHDELSPLACCSYTQHAE